jgi:3'(2'), 5'-bisphosphate nucleotidase
MMHSLELQTAIQAVTKASAVCMTIRSSSACEEAISKKDRSPVTIADFGSQAVIIHELLRVFPDARIVAEEDSAQMQALQGTPLGQDMVRAVTDVVPEANWEMISEWVSRGNFEGSATGRFWTIDPIDGTKGFLRNEQYAVALALIEDGEPILGVLGCPNYPLHSFENPDAGSGVMFFTEKGMGAKKLALDEKDFSKAGTIRVSPVQSTSEARLCESWESSHSSHADSERIADALGITRESLRIDSQCKYAAVASGDASIYLRMPTSADYREKIWDHGAGYIVNLEAGGRVTDIDGRKLDFSLGRTLINNRGIVAAPKSIHAEVLAAIKN